MMFPSSIWHLQFRVLAVSRTGQRGARISMKHLLSARMPFFLYWHRSPRYSQAHRVAELPFDSNSLLTFILDSDTRPSTIRGSSSPILNTFLSGMTS